jgi:hypothetical protein
MKSKDIGILFGIIATIVFGYLIFSNIKRSKEIKELKDTLNSNNLISDKIKEQLLSLIGKHPHIDEDIKGELSQIAMLIGIQQETKAILSLAKIIESILKKMFSRDNDFKMFLKSNNKKKAVFADYLDFAKEKKVIATEDYHLISVLKTIRNEEAHELNVIKDRSKLIGCFISGIGVVISLYNLLKLSLLEDETTERSRVKA